MRIDISFLKYHSIFVSFIGMDLRRSRYNFECLERIANYRHHLLLNRNDVMCPTFLYTLIDKFYVNLLIIDVKMNDQVRKCIMVLGKDIPALSGLDIKIS